MNSPLALMFSKLWDILSIEFNYYGFTFTLYDVFLAQLWIIVIGLVFEQIFLFATNNYMRGH